MTNYTKREQEAYDYGYHKRDAEIEALKARVEELETRVVDLSVMIDKERLENGIEIVALKEKVRWFQAKEVG